MPSFKLEYFSKNKYNSEIHVHCVPSSCLCACRVYRSMRSGSGTITPPWWRYWRSFHLCRCPVHFSLPSCPCCSRATIPSAPHQTSTQERFTSLWPWSPTALGVSLAEVHWNLRGVVQNGPNFPTKKTKMESPTLWKPNKTRYPVRSELLNRLYIFLAIRTNQ